MSQQPEYLYYRELFSIFKAYTTPKLMRVLDSQGIKYFTDAKGKPFTTRSAIEGALGSEGINAIVPSTAPEGLSESSTSLS
tara:strand:- start:1047 stop:1289 length:243 start_codon:yes stop_codon:yes gene_type:complete